MDPEDFMLYLEGFTFVSFLLKSKARRESASKSRNLLRFAFLNN